MTIDEEIGMNGTQGMTGIVDATDLTEGAAREIIVIAEMIAIEMIVVIATEMTAGAVAGSFDSKHSLEIIFLIKNTVNSSR